MVSVKPKVPLKAKNKKDNKPVKIEKQNKKAKPQKPKPKLTPPSPKETKIVKQVKEEIKKEDASKKKAKYVMPTASITDDLVNSCLTALLDVIVPNDRQKNKIFEDEKPIFAEIHSMKIQNTKGNVRFVLPHSTVASTGEVCLVTPDIKKGRKHDHEPTIDRWEEILRKEGVTGVKTVLPVRQLKVEYDQFELKRRLLTQHDFIMVDTRVLNHVSHILGKMFFKKHNMLVPVRINEEKNLKKSIDIGLRTAILRLSEGETSTITIGHTAMSKEKLKENIIALVHQLQTKFPGGEANIRAISLKLPLSVSLPLYLTLRPSSTVKPPRLTQKRPKHYTVLEDELSTMPGKVVRVAPDGTVKLKNLKQAPKASKNKKVVEREVDDEEEEELEDEDDSEELEESETNDE